jgi:hypothetical protein
MNNDGLLFLSLLNHIEEGFGAKQNAAGNC